MIYKACDSQHFAKCCPLPELEEAVEGVIRTMLGSERNKRHWSLITPAQTWAMILQWILIAITLEKMIIGMFQPLHYNSSLLTFILCNLAG